MSKVEKSNIDLKWIGQVSGLASLVLRLYHLTLRTFHTASIRIKSPNMNSGRNTAITLDMTIALESTITLNTAVALGITIVLKSTITPNITIASDITIARVDHHS